MSKQTLFALALAILVGIPILGMIQTKVTRSQSGLGSTANFMMLRQKNADLGESTQATEPMMAPYAADMAPSQTRKMAGMPATDGLTISPGYPVPNSGGFTPGVERTIVKNAYVSILAKDTRDTVSQITSSIKEFNGLVTASNVYETEYEQGVVRADMTIRVPVDQLDAALTKITSFASKVTTETISAQDQTEQKIDIDAQLKNLRASEEQLLTILKQANTVEETLQVQRELTNTRSQIERLEAQLENLVGDAAMATIQVSISTREADLPVVDPGRRTLLEEMKLAVREAVRLYRELFVAGLRLSIIGLPLLVVAGVGYFLLRKKK